MESTNKKDRYLNFSGSSQGKRYSKALKEGYVLIDEKSYTNNLVYAFGLSKLINYYDLNGKVESDWSDFLIDEAVVLAAITFVKPSEIENNFKTNYQKVLLLNNINKKLFYLENAFKAVFDIGKKIDTWYVNLRIVEDFINDEVNIRNEIANIISNKLAPFMHKLKAMVLGASDKTAINVVYKFDFKSLNYIWNLEGIKPSTVAYEGKTKGDRINNAGDTLQFIFQEFYEAIIYIKQKAQDYLDDSLKSDHHFPEVALLLSFLELYKYPQKQINQLSNRYLDYYYKTILQQSGKEAVNSQVFLSFMLDNDIQQASIPKGSQFIAGADKTGKNILFQTDYDFEVNRAQLKHLYNIYLAKNKISYGKETFEHIDNIYTNELKVFDNQNKDAFDKMKSQPVFGENQKGKGDSDRTMSDAMLGFAVASPALFLKEGKREIDVVLNLKKNAYNKILEYLNIYSRHLNISMKEMIVKCFLDAFIIELSAENGWMNVKRYVVSLDDNSNSIIIKFDVLSEMPPIVAFDKQVHNAGFETGYPVIKIVLNNKSYIYSYFLLKETEIEQIAVHTTVKGVKDLYIQNNVGPVNTDNPFLPFGPVPDKGSYMIIGSNEVFQKQLNELKINIEWFKVPNENQGFAQYYKEYKTNVDNTSFEAGLSILDSGTWLPEDNVEKQKIKLFRTVGKENKPEPDAKSLVSDQLVLDNINISKIRQEPNFKEISGSQVYSTLSKRGFLKIELTNPMHAFGHAVYPNILSDITLENSKTGFLKGKKKKPLPNSPFTPTIKSLTIDYKSSSVISIKDNQAADSAVLNELGQLFHIYPYGVAKVYPDSSVKQVKLIPSFDYQGALFLGFKDIRAPQAISVLFEMLDEFTISSEEEPPEIEWSYLANNNWFHIKPANIIRDDTNGFLRTGIIMVNVPAEINQMNTILSPGYYWLRVTVRANVEGASNLISVASQVVKATLVGTQELYNSDYLEKNLPPDTIQKPLKNLKGVKNVFQPLSSFNGQPFEKEVAFKTRVSERLRHRDRAVSCWDYERLVLNRFPQIERATCLPNMSSSNLNAPGNILLVVSPYPENVINSKEPRTSSELLYEIKSFLKKYTSPFVNIEVRNPSYERIRVICSVKFAEAHNHGYYIQKLNEHINTYLGGKMGGDSHGSLIGKVVYCSDVITYIRTLPFIQFVTRFSIVQAARDITGNYVLIDTAREGDEKDGLKATKPWSVLVPSDQHQITVMIDKKEEQSMQAGIDYLELGGDFIIND